jgi:Ca-activated chloride channel family protein
MSDVLQLTSQCNKASVPVFSQPQLVYLLTELQPGPAMANVHLPLNFALVLDRSYSMDASQILAEAQRELQAALRQTPAHVHHELHAQYQAALQQFAGGASISWDGARLQTMKEAVRNIINQLEPEDVISIIAFAETPTILVPAQPARNKDALAKQIKGIVAAPSTSIASALAEGLNQVRRYQSPDRLSRIVLLTDGDPTDNPDDSRRLADMAGSMGIPIICLGFGEDWNEDFLFDLADRSLLATGSHTGYADYIQSPERANAIFQQVFQSMQVVAQNVQVTIRMAQGIEARRVWQVTPMLKDIGLSAIQGRAVVIPVGDLEKGGAAYLVEMMLPPRPAGNVRIAQTEASYAAPGRGLQKEAMDLVVSFTNDLTLTSQLNGKVMNVVERVQAFKLQTQALDEAQMGNVKGATQKLRQVVTILLSQGETELANQMEKEARNLEQSGQISSEGKKTIKLTSRKTIRLSE